MRPCLTWTSQQLLQVVEQSEALLIGHRGEGLVRVHVLEGGHQVGQRVVGSKRVHLGGGGGGGREEEEEQSGEEAPTEDEVVELGGALTDSCRSFHPPMALNCLKGSPSRHLPIILSR